jgi:hypothetical protein
MLHRRKWFEHWGIWLAVLAVAGCGAPDWTRSMNDSFRYKDSSSKAVEEKHRQEYEATHSRKSMRWLLSHCVEPGMSLDQVTNIMGVEGTRELHDRAFKSHGGGYFVDDEMYSWKDDEGHAIYLGFREDRLVNFEQADFR